MASVTFTPQQRLLVRVLVALLSVLAVKWVFWDSKPITPPGEIEHPAILERITLGSPLSGQSLDTRKYSFLQTRINRDESPDLFDGDIRAGIKDFWSRFQKPFALSSETMHLDEQVVRGAVDELLGFNGWAAAACSSLTRPFAQQRKDDDWSDLAPPGALYYFALVVHGADHFLIDQLAVIVQLSKRLGPNSIFVSLVDYASNDSTPFICDMAEAVMILLGISFRIRQVPPMTADPTASYYPLEEAYTRNLALEPMVELWTRRKVKFSRVIWLKGFTCPNDILETLRVSVVNQASMVCSMDWKEHNGFFIYNDRWRTRDMDGNLFRGSKSTSPIDEAPPRDAYGGARYTLHLPFQVFCCESGAHIVDPHKSYYEGVTYQSSHQAVFNISAASDVKAPRWSEGPCMDSSQLHFCRDMWMVAFRDGIRNKAKHLLEEERRGRGRKVHPFMEELIQATLASYAPSTSDKIGYANSGDYLAEETGAAPGGGPGMDNEVGATLPEGATEEAGEEEEGEYEDEGGEGDEGDETDEAYDEDEGGKGRPIDLAVEINDESPDSFGQAKKVDRQPLAVKLKAAAVAAAAGLPAAGAAAAIGDAVDAAVGGAAAGAAGAIGAAGAGAAGAAAVVVGADKQKGEDKKKAKDKDKEKEKTKPKAEHKDKKPKVPEPKKAPAKVADAEAPAAAAPPAAKEWIPVDPDAAPAPVPAAAPQERKPVEKGKEEKRAEQDTLKGKKVKRNLLSWFKRDTTLGNSPLSARHETRSNITRRNSNLEKRRPRSLPNHEFDYAIAKILVNPRCVTTYAGVSHTQLALDLFGSGEDKEPAMAEGGKYELDEWRTPPESFVCQEMRTTGGRIAAKQQRRTGFQMARLMLNGWRPT